MNDPSSPSEVVTLARQTRPGLPLRRVWLVVGAWAVVIAIASVNQPSWALQRGALFLHLAALVAGFGAVLVVDLHGVLWLIGRRRLGDLLLVTSALQPLIWGGLFALRCESPW